MASSCKKQAGSVPDNGFYISYTHGNSQNTYNTNAFAHSDTTLDGVVSFGFIAYTKDTSTFFQIGLESKLGLKVGIIYTDPPSDNFGHFRLFNYLQNTGFESEDIDVPNVKVNLTEITPATVKGNFSGNMCDAPGGPIYAITGTFYLPIK